MMLGPAIPPPWTRPAVDGQEALLRRSSNVRSGNEHCTYSEDNTNSSQYSKSPQCRQNIICQSKNVPSSINSLQR